MYIRDVVPFSRVISDMLESVVAIKRVFIDLVISATLSLSNIVDIVDARLTACNAKSLIFSSLAEENLYHSATEPPNPPNLTSS